MSKLISNFKFQISNYKQNKGFTLIELIVVIAVFLLVIGAAISIFISVVQNQRKILAEQELLSQTSYVIEYISKALRVAKKDTDGSCLGTDYIGHSYLLTRGNLSSPYYQGIKFINQSNNNACQEFFLDRSDLSGAVLKELKNSTNDSNAVALTSSNININSIRFSINGIDGLVGMGDSDKGGIQPRVTIFLDVKSNKDANQVSKKIQTTVSQLDLNTE